MAGSAAVFLAKVVKIETDDASFTKTVTLEVERAWKGVEAKTITVSTAKHGATCGYGFQDGGAYLVYAHAPQKGGPLHVSLCSRTRTLAQAKDDLAALGEGTVVKDAAKKE